jgi:hypothetical protein
MTLGNNLLRLDFPDPHEKIGVGLMRNYMKKCLRER